MGKNKPSNTAFKQQRLKAWQPLLTPKSVLPTFFIVGFIFAPLGALLLLTSDNVTEITIDYTQCNQASSTFENIPSDQYEIFIPPGTNATEIIPLWKAEEGNFLPPEQNPNNLNTTRCFLRFSVPTNLEPPVFLYYRLTNFYQNHRRYVRSLNMAQLKGEAVSASGLESVGCSELATDPDGKIYYPCGLIANSIFNDTISDLYYLDNDINETVSVEKNITYSLTSEGIAWPVDKDRYKKYGYQLEDIVPPRNWQPRYPDGKYTEEFPPPDITEDEHFQVWMRTAAFPDFRKLYSKNTTSTLKKGIYEVHIDMNFDATSFGGTKSLVISSSSLIGARNAFLGISYITVGVVCVVLGFLFTASHLYRPRKLGDHTYLSWNQQLNSGLAGPPSAGGGAKTTG